MDIKYTHQMAPVAAHKYELHSAPLFRALSLQTRQISKSSEHVKHYQIQAVGKP